ncbi:MAG: phage tail protein [Alphaproteobacteria bacterium]|nr:phage tail protein [Alphaproteobacteria bacterium]
MFAQLGGIRFSLPAYVTATDAERAQSFAKHERIEGKPVLQAIGTDLEQITLEVTFHVGFSDPELEIVRLRAAADRQEAMPLIYGNGTYRGRYVITRLAEKVRQSDPRGNLIKVTARIELQEWHGPPSRVPTVDPARNEGRASGANSAQRTLPPPAGPAPGADPKTMTPKEIARRP